MSSTKKTDTVQAVRLGGIAFISLWLILAIVGWLHGIVVRGSKIDALVSSSADNYILVPHPTSNDYRIVSRCAYNGYFSVYYVNSNGFRARVDYNSALSLVAAGASRLGDISAPKALDSVLSVATGVGLSEFIRRSAANSWSKIGQRFVGQMNSTGRDKQALKIALALSGYFVGRAVSEFDPPNCGDQRVDKALSTSLDARLLLERSMFEKWRSRLTSAVHDSFDTVNYPRLHNMSEEASHKEIMVLMNNEDIMIEELDKLGAVLTKRDLTGTDFQKLEKVCTRHQKTFGLSCTFPPNVGYS